MGVLRVDLMSGRDIRGADRSGMGLLTLLIYLKLIECWLGKSDPFVVFTLNGQKVFKSETKKKTLTPEWNEPFSVQVVS